MPNLDGIALIRQVRALPQCKYIPIVMLTTESQDTKKQAGREAGASGWIVKPFRSEQLVLVARKLLPL
jgi:two-component system chemotaxis response regulator CheY